MEKGARRERENSKTLFYKDCCLGLGRERDDRGGGGGGRENERGHFKVTSL